MKSVEYDGFINIVTSKEKYGYAEVIVAFRTDRFGIVQVMFEPPKEIPEIEKTVEAMDAKLKTPPDEPNINMFSLDEVKYMKKYCTAVYILVQSADSMANQNS